MSFRRDIFVSVAYTADGYSVQEVRKRAIELVAAELNNAPWTNGGLRAFVRITTNVETDADGCKMIVARCVVGELDIPQVHERVG